MYVCLSVYYIYIYIYVYIHTLNNAQYVLFLYIVTKAHTRAENNTVQFVS